MIPFDGTVVLSGQRLNPYIDISTISRVQTTSKRTIHAEHERGLCETAKMVLSESPRIPVGSDGALYAHEHGETSSDTKYTIGSRQQTIRSF